MKHYIVLAISLVISFNLWGSAITSEVVTNKTIPKKESKFLDEKSNKEFQGMDPNELRFVLLFGLYNMYYMLDIIPDDVLIDKIKMFQQDLGDEPTGKLSLSQITKFFNRVDLTGKKRVIINDEQYAFEEGNDYFHGKGTIKLAEKKHGAPVNIFDIECYKNAKVCLANFVTVIPYSAYYNLSMTKLKYEIYAWSEDEIIAAHKAGCVIEKVNIDLKQKKMYQFVTFNESNAGCKLMDPSEYPIVGEIIPGFHETMENASNENKKEAKYFSSQAIDKLKSIFK